MEQNINEKMKMNLQLLADEGNEGNPGASEGSSESNQTNNTEGAEKATKITMTQEELDKMFDRKYAQWQKKADEKVKEAEAKARREAEKEKEAQRLANMTENERLTEEVKQANAKFEQLQRDMELRDLNEEKKKQLKTLGISEEYATFIVGENADEIHSNLERFAALKKQEAEATEKYINDEVEKRVNARLKGNGNFKDHSTRQDSNIDYSNMSDEEYYRQYFAKTK